jgi:hypothetical protein
MWYVIGLIWLALIVGIIWAYRKKREKHASERAKQLDALFAELKLNPNLPVGATTGAATPVAVAQSNSKLVPDFGKKQHLLQQVEALVYYVFKTGLPDHEIFAHLTLADLVDIEPTLHGYEREQKVRRLAQQRLDLVICTRQLEVVAVVAINKTGPDAMQALNAQFVEKCLQTVGIRLVHIDPALPPRHHQVRDLVYGTTS